MPEGPLHGPSQFPGVQGAAISLHSNHYPCPPETQSLTFPISQRKAPGLTEEETVGSQAGLLSTASFEFASLFAARSWAKDTA